MQIKEVKKILDNNYSFSYSSIIIGPRQFAGITYIVKAGNNNKYFVKIINKKGIPNSIATNLPVLEELNNLGLENIPQVIRTNLGGLFIETEDSVFVVFNYLEGKQTYEFNKKKLGLFISKFHTLTKEIRQEVEKESFDSYANRNFLDMFNQVFKLGNQDLINKRLKEMLLPYRQEILDDFNKFLEVIEQCKKKPQTSYVLTHGDIPINVMENKKGEQYVIDWDDILLAPPERDLWFFKDTPSLLNQYRKTFTNYKINNVFYKYYLYWRLFSDMYAFIKEIRSNKSEEHRRKNLKELKEDYLDWLRPIIKEESKLCPAK
jgi:fructosamine-3-kinase